MCISITAYVVDDVGVPLLGIPNCRFPRHAGKKAGNLKFCLLLFRLVVVVSPGLTHSYPGNGVIRVDKYIISEDLNLLPYGAQAFLLLKYSLPDRVISERLRVYRPANTFILPLLGGSCHLISSLSWIP